MKVVFPALMLVAVVVIPVTLWGQQYSANGLITKSPDGYVYYNQRHQWNIEVPQTFKLLRETQDGAVFGDGTAVISVFSAKQKRKPLTPPEFLALCKSERLKRGHEKILMQGLGERSCVLLTNNRKKGYVFFQNAFPGTRFVAVAFIEYQTSSKPGYYAALQKNIHNFNPGAID